MLLHEQDKFDTMVSHEELKQILHYSPTTGVFKWLVVSSSRTRPGTIAGSTDDKGYIQITINKKKYAAHRLAWFYIKGEWPLNTIDHKDLNRSNNRWLNLRLATRSQQIRNTRSKRGGLKGAYFEKRSGRWFSQICLGYFDTEIAAHTAYKNAVTGLFGEFARVD